MHYIFGNYGDNTVAVIQWAYLNQLKNVTLIHIETGWGASCWQKRVVQAQQLAKKYHFDTVTLKPSHDFEFLVRDRKSFPNAKFQWCATFLKAMPFLKWLDEVDDKCEATVILGSRQHDSRAKNQLTEFINESEHYGNRRVWFPLYNMSNNDRDELIKQTGFEVLNYRSLECNPCIHGHPKDLSLLSEKIIQRIANLEKEISETMFHSRYPNKNIQSLIADQNTQNKNSTLDMGCGSFYMCGE